MEVLTWLGYVVGVIIAIIISVFTTRTYIFKNIGKNADGKIIIHNIDETMKAQMELDWVPKYEKLMKQSYVVFEIENHMKSNT